MLVKEIKSIAKEMDISLGKMNKAQLIQAIQNKEGNNPCFGTAGKECDQTECKWRTDCLK